MRVIVPFLLTKKPDPALSVVFKSGEIGAVQIPRAIIDLQKGVLVERFGRAVVFASAQLSEDFLRFDELGPAARWATVRSRVLRDAVIVALPNASRW